MIEKTQIQRWVEKGIINQEQAERIQTDIIQFKKERSSNRFITAISTIGAILLGVGVILFMASNWEKIPDFVKVIMLLGSTLGSYGIGYFLKYKQESFPKVGASLIFLSTLLFGATLFLIAQMYHSSANAHWLVLIWLVCILPVVYLFEFVPVAGLTVLLFFIWIWLYFFSRNDDFIFARYISSLPVTYLVSGLALFAIGGLHYLSQNYTRIARIYRIAGLKAGLVSLFLLSFETFSKTSKYSLENGLDANFSRTLLVGFVIFSLIAVVLSLVNTFFNPAKSDNPYIEGGVSAGLSLLALIVFFFPTSTVLYTVLFNLILLGVIIVLLYEGYHREDMRLVNLGIFWLEALIVVRYFDFFWDLLPRSLFFMVGGIVLIFASVMLEKKRRKLKKRFDANITVENNLIFNG